MPDDARTGAAAERVLFKVYRSEGGGEPRYDTFEVPASPGMTVLGALFRIRDQMDGSLAFRYSCRGAVCGSCAMLINGVPRLACRTQVAALLNGAGDLGLKRYPAMEPPADWDPEAGILVEPLPHLPVQKDLMVDMERFFEHYRAVEPVFRPGEDAPDGERHMEPADLRELEKYTNCILCGACFGACPVDGERQDYLGPAALAKLYRFHIDPREAQDGSRLMTANHASGWWGCEFHTNCRKVCPKGVPPNLAIGRARQELEAAGKVPVDMD